jgi:hypothetical protein
LEEWIDRFDKSFDSKRSDCKVACIENKQVACALAICMTKSDMEEHIKNTFISHLEHGVPSAIGHDLVKLWYHAGLITQELVYNLAYHFLNGNWNHAIVDMCSNYALGAIMMRLRKQLEDPQVDFNLWAPFNYGSIHLLAPDAKCQFYGSVLLDYLLVKFARAVSRIDADNGNIYIEANGHSTFAYRHLPEQMAIAKTLLQGVQYELSKQWDLFKASSEDGSTSWPGEDGSTSWFSFKGVVSATQVYVPIWCIEHDRRSYTCAPCVKAGNTFEGIPVARGICEHFRPTSQCKVCTPTYQKKPYEWKSKAAQKTYNAEYQKTYQRPTCPHGNTRKDRCKHCLASKRTNNNDGQDLTRFGFKKAKK